MTATAVARLTDARDAAERAGLVLLRASPRGPDRLLLALGQHGAEVAGQWFSDPDRCRQVAERTSATGQEDDVTVHEDHLLVQRAGADRRLPALARLVADGATLVAHRPERRGVVRDPGGERFVKVVAAGRAGPLAQTLRTVALTSTTRVPPVLDCDDAAGTLTLGALPGRTLHELLQSRDHPTVLRAGRLVGSAVARWHATPLPTGHLTGQLGEHRLAHEHEVTERWVSLAEAHVGLPRAVRRAAASVRRTRLDVGPSAGGSVLLHRDLHDKQLLVADPADPSTGTDDRVGLLDLDLLAVGDPALDLANLLVHLELRARQGLLRPDLCRLLARAVISGYGPDDSVRAGLSLHGRLTRLRLAALYAFRPRSAAAAARLVEDRPLLPEVA